MIKLTAEEDRRLTEAATLLRTNPAFPAIESHIKRLLEDTKNSLITNRSEQVPNLQGRAQNLIDILDLLNRKKP